MFKRYFSSVMIVTSAFTIVFGQTETTKPSDESPQTFAFHFDGDGGYLGVLTQEVSKDNFAKFGLKDVRGVAIEKVLENSPAAAAGLQAGDVIVRVNGEEIASSRKLTRLIGEIDPDHQVKLTVSRNGSEREITATVGKRPGMSFGNGNFSFSTPEPFGKLDLEKFKGLENLKDMPVLKNFPDMKDFPKGEGFKSFTFPEGNGQVFSWSSGSGRQIGIGVYAVTKQLGERYGVDGGVMINEVRENSPAAKAGLKAGDIIVEAGGKAVKNDFDLIRVVNEKKEGDVQLTIVRDGKRQTISVTPEASKDNGFVFRNGDENGLTLTPRAPIQLSRPAMPMVSPAPLMKTLTPMTPRSPMLTIGRPGRII